MIGRGTRLAPNLFGKGLDKREFYVFDYCDNLRRFEDAEHIVSTTGSQQHPLSERTFLRRIELASLLPADDPTRADLVSGLRNQLQTVPTSSVLVRPDDRADLEHYLRADAWGSGTDIESAGKLAYLPFADDPERRRTSQTIRLSHAHPATSPRPGRSLTHAPPGSSDQHRAPPIE